MDKERSNLHSKERHEDEVMEALLGPDDDFLDEAHSVEFLLAFGIDPATLVSEFKEHLEERARQYQTERGSVPDPISDALRGIREHIKSNDPMNVDPSSHIDLLLTGALLNAEPSGTFARAYRRDSDDELCEEDQAVLDGLEAELNKEDPTSTK